MIGKTMKFEYNGVTMEGDVIDTILMDYGKGVAETGYLVLVNGLPFRVNIDMVIKIYP
jgi:hypothetical protein